MASLQDQLNGIEQLVDKTRGELLAEINTLQNRIDSHVAGEIPSEVQSVIDRIREKLLALDARNPDFVPIASEPEVPAPTPEPSEPTTHPTE